MKNNDQHNHDFDQAFNERFSDFQFKPNPDLFDRIQEGIESNKFDQEVKNRFEEFSVIPSDEVWESVEPHLPLHLGMLVQLQRLTKVAAVVLFVMSGFYLYEIQQPSPASVADNISTPSETNETAVATETDFVFEIPESISEKEVASDQSKKKLRKKKKSKKKGTADYLALILGEEDDFDELIDHQRMKEMLQPVEQLSSEFMSASALAPLPRYKSYPVVDHSFDIELNINIPLQVVEPHEVDELIRLYDETQAERE